MDRETSTRERILREAERLFVEGGYHATALQEVADRIGITKPALYYHFSSKAEILGALLDPMTAELEQVLAQAAAEEERNGVQAVRTRLVTGWLDIFLRYRNTMLTLVRELPATPSGSFARLLAVMEEAVETGAGTGSGDRERIFMAQAVSAIADPVALMPQLSDEVLREHVLAGIQRLLGSPEAPPEPRRARAGRPRSVSDADAELARSLYASGEHSAETIAARLGVSRATVYRILKSSA